MVKLLRLTSEKDCNFNANIDEELIVSTNASIGVKNLTFEPNFQAINLSNAPLEDTEILFGADLNTFGNSEAVLNPVNYKANNIDTFFTDMINTLNNTLDPVLEDDATGAATEKQQFYGQFFIDPDEERKTIEFRLTPVIVPLITRECQTLDPTQAIAVDDFMISSRDASGDDKVNVSSDATPTSVGELCLVNRETGLAAANTRDAFMVTNNPSLRWSNGSSVFWVRIAELSDNGGAADTNGFEFGLGTYQGFEIDDDMDSNSIKFAIRVRRPADDIQHIVPNTDFTSNPVYVTNTGVTPSATVNADFGKRDILMIQREKILSSASGTPQNCRIRGYLFKEGVAPDVLFSYELDKDYQSESLYPYITFFAADTDAVVSQPSVTYDPFEIEGKEENGFLTLLKPHYANKFGGVSSFASITMAALSETDIPDLLDDWFDGNPPTGFTADTQLTISKKVLKFMGFGRSVSGNGTGTHTFKPIISTTSFPYGFELIPSNVFQATNSDNYVVVIDNLKVKSYDCSKNLNAVNNGNFYNDMFDKRQGKRANILATIPVNDNTSGIVEFDANEVLYIDIDNKTPLNIRNINIRVLDKALNEIDTSGISVITILIKDE